MGSRNDTNSTPNTLLYQARRRTPSSSPLRHGKCMTRRELADAVNVAMQLLHPQHKGIAAFYVDERWIGKMERGEHRWSADVRRTALRHVLGVASDAEIGLHPRLKEELDLPLLTDDPANPRMPMATTAADASPTSRERQGNSGTNEFALSGRHLLTHANDVNDIELCACRRNSIGFGPGTPENVVDVLMRVDALHRNVDPFIIDQLQANVRQLLESYESIDHGALGVTLRKQRHWITTLLDNCRKPSQQRRLFEAGAATSGLLGYVAVGRGDFALAHAYCFEAFTMGEYAEDSNLQAWARGLQSFCEYYACNYSAAVHLALDGLTYARGGPQSVRLAVNGVARALGKLGDVQGVHRAVDDAYEFMSTNEVSCGLPSSITLECYSAAQTASNAATAYVSLGATDKVEHFIGVAMPEIGKSGSPWSRSLVAIDLASSLVRSADPDLDHAVHLALDALAISHQRPIIAVRQRVKDFIDEATIRFGSSPRIDMVREAAGAGAAYP